MRNYFPHVDKRTQRLRQDEELKQRKTGHWAPWRPIPEEGPQGMIAMREGARGGAWAKDFHTGWINGWAVVCVRTIAGTSKLGVVQHAMITTATLTEFTWKEKQRLKNELFGADRTAIEIMPREADKIDEANSYHLWILPTGYRFEFGIGEGQR